MQVSLWTQIRRGILQGRAYRRKLFVNVCFVIHDYSHYTAEPTVLTGFGAASQRLQQLTVGKVCTSTDSYGS